MKKCTLSISIALFSMFITFANADHLSPRLLFSAHLSGANVVPSPVLTTASGVAAFMLNAARDTMYFTFSSTGLSGPITGIHIHEGSPSENGPILIDLQFSVTLNTANARIAIKRNTLQKFLESKLYINVHTSANPNGEIRGNIRLETDFGFFSSLDGSQQVPPVSTSAKGISAINLSMDGKKLEVKVVADGLSGNIQSAHLHKGTVGTNGGILVDLTPMISGRGIFGTVNVPDSLRNGVLASYIMSGQIYVNLHTTANPNGEVRGQVTSDKTLRFDSKLDTASETGTPNSSSNGMGSAVFSLSNTFDTLRYNILLTNLSGPIQAAHFHQAAPNTDGPVVFDLGSSINGNVISGMWTSNTPGTPLNQALVNAMLSGNLYVNVHTSANPNGEVRGQVYRLAREGFVADIDAAQEDPASVSMALGAALASYDRNRTNLHYMAVVDGLTGPVTGAHFHKGIRGVAGPIIFDLTSNVSNEAAFGFWTSDDTPSFNDAQSVTFRQNDSVYINFHTATYPNGEVRGQMERNYTNASQVVGVEENKTVVSEISIYPNPSDGPAFIGFNTVLGFEGIIQVSDLTGRILSEQRITASGGFNTHALNLSELTNGIFIIRLVNNKATVWTSKAVRY